MELIGAARHPSDDENVRHMRTLKISLRAPCRLSSFSAHRDKAVFQFVRNISTELLQETWELLRDFNMLGTAIANSNYPTTEPMGLTVMSILADCCAGTTRSRITDRGSSYATLAGVIGAHTGQTSAINTDTADQLVPISLEVLNVTSISLEKLIAFRRREQGRGGTDYTQLRHRYLNALENCIKELTTAQGHASNITK